MTPTLATVAVSAMIGVLIGTAVHEFLGAKRSSVGIHRRDGRIMPFWEGVIVFAIVISIASFFTTHTSLWITNEFPGMMAVLFCLFWLSVFLSATSYSR